MFVLLDDLLQGSIQLLLLLLQKLLLLRMERRDREKGGMGDRKGVSRDKGRKWGKVKVPEGDKRTMGRWGFIDRRWRDETWAWGGGMQEMVG